ncbi:MAG: class I SAM-dependent rRNA methyltransferase [Chloroflexota bacterium]
MDQPDGYQLLDCGRGRRLEAFGHLIVDRPAPMADGSRRGSARWGDAITYRAGRGWADPEGARPEHDSSPVAIAGVILEARLGSGGQVGLYPEHAAYADSLRNSVRARIAGDDAGDAAPPELLNLFGHTGLLTLVAAEAGARVTHVDASRPAVGAARHNAELSGLAERPIRWIVDDAMAFVLREIRRGRHYDGFIIDPPSYGHGARGNDERGWLLDRDLGPLLAACQELANDDASWILSAHTPGWDGRRMAMAIEDATRMRAPAEQIELEIVAESGAVLALGSAVILDPLRADQR